MKTLWLRCVVLSILWKYADSVCVSNITSTDGIVFPINAESLIHVDLRNEVRK